MMFGDDVFMCFHSFTESNKEKATKPERLLFILYASVIVYLLYISCNSLWGVYNRNLSFDPFLYLAIALLILLFLAVGYLFFFFHLYQVNIRRGAVFTIFLILGLVEMHTLNNYLSSGNQTHLLLFALSLIPIPLVFLICPFFLKDQWNHPNFWVLFGVTLALFLLLSGTIFIDNVYGYRILSGNLNLANNTSIIYAGNGTIVCKSIVDKIVAGATVTCYPTPAFNFSNGIINFTDNMGKVTGISLNSTISFEAPQNTKRIYFELNGYDSENKAVNVSTGLLYTVYTYQELNDRYQNLLSSFFLLITGVLFIVPSLIINIRDIMGNNRRQ
jgi:hypothetical protein